MWATQRSQGAGEIARSALGCRILALRANGQLLQEARWPAIDLVCTPSLIPWVFAMTLICALDSRANSIVRKVFDLPLQPALMPELCPEDLGVAQILEIGQRKGPAFPYIERQSRQPKRV